MAKHKNLQAAPSGAAVQATAADAGQTVIVEAAQVAAATDTVLPTSTETPVAVSPAEVIADAVPEEASAFPALFKISNDTPSRAAFPVVNAIIESHDSVVVEIRDEDQLTRFRTDAQRLCEVNGWVDGFTATLHTAE